MQYLPLHLVGLSSFKTTSKYMKFCLQMNKKGRLVASYTLFSLTATEIEFASSKKIVCLNEIDNFVIKITLLQFEINI